MSGMYFSNVNFPQSEVGSAEGLAYDATNETLYWTSYTNSSISCIKMDSSKKHNRRKLVQLSAEDHPRAIVLDPCAS